MDKLPTFNFTMIETPCGKLGVSASAHCGCGCKAVVDPCAVFLGLEEVKDKRQATLVLKAPMGVSHVEMLLALYNGAVDDTGGPLFTRENMARLKHMEGSLGPDGQTLVMKVAMKRLKAPANDGEKTGGWRTELMSRARGECFKPEQLRS